MTTLESPATSAPARTTPKDFSLVLPRGWSRLPMDDLLPERIVRDVAEQVDGLPAGRRESARQQLTRSLKDAVTQAEQAGATDLLVCRQRVRHTVLSASGMVLHRTGAQDAQQLLRELGEQAGEVGVTEVDGLPAVRLLRTTPQDTKPEQVVAYLAQQGLEVGEQDVPDIVRGDATWVVPLRGTSGHLLFSWTTLERPEVVEAVLTLFDAAMGTLRWVW